MGLFNRRAVVAVALLAFSLAGCDKLFPQKSAVTADDMSLGDPNAKVTVIEYASASCPHCAAFNNTVFPAFKAKYIDTGQVRYVMREILTPPVEVAAAGFLTARCGGKDKYFTILDQIFRHQQELYQTGDVQGVLGRAAQTAGLTQAQFNACVFDGNALGALNTRVNTYAKRDEITGTPTFIINGQPLAAGEPTLERLDAAVAAAGKAH